MNGDFTPILILILVASVICTAMVSLSYILGPKKVTPYKQAPYECGVAPIGDARERFPIKFYLVAMLFILFDIEVVFLWSWVSVYRHETTAFQMFTLVEVLLYMLTWVIGYAYVLRVNAIDWDDSTGLELAKLGEANAEKHVSVEPSGEPISAGWGTAS